MGNLIQGARVGSIVRTSSRQQYFYVHNIENDNMCMSGISLCGYVFSKGYHLMANEVVPEDEEHIFFESLNKYNLKLNLNKGIVRC